MILSGLLDDGATGLGFIKEHGGATVVQDPDDAMFAGMPRSAIDVAPPDRVAPLSEIADVLAALIDETILDPVKPVPAPIPEPAAPDPAVAALVDGPPTGLTCPECGGALWAEADGELVRFACHVGHAYGEDSLVDSQSRALERSLWSALRSLQENADMMRRLARRSANNEMTRQRFETRAAETDEHADALRRLLSRLNSVPAADVVGDAA